MARLKMPKGELKVYDAVETPVAEEDTTLADTATALLEGGEGDAGEDDGDSSEGIGLPREDWHPEDAAAIDNGEVGDDLPTGHYEQPATETAESETRTAIPHILYKAGDADLPDSILDSNGEVAIGLCRVCGAGERDLDGPCTPPADAVAADAEQPVADADQPVVGESSSISLDVGELPASEVAAIAAATDLNQITEAMRLRLQRAQAIREWQQNCEDAKERFVAAALAHAELKAATKIAKAEEEDTMEAYAKLMRQNPDVAYSPTNAPMNTRPVAEVTAEQPSSSEDTTLVDNGEAAAVAGSGDPDAWRSTPITALTSLTPKIIEKLQDAGLHTMGKLAARQEEISLSDGREKWPKGIGEVKITAIEDAIIDWLNENRDKQVFADLASGATGEEQAKEQADGDDSEEAEGFTGADDAANYVADAHQHEQATAILARASEIDNGEPDSLDEKIVDAGYWEQGWNHHQNGEKLETCDWGASAAQDDFIRGYLSAAKADGYGKADGEAVAPAPAQAEQQSVTTPTDLDIVDLDNL